MLSRNRYKNPSVHRCFGEKYCQLKSAYPDSMGMSCQRWLMMGSVEVGITYLPTLDQCWAEVLKMTVDIMIHSWKIIVGLMLVQFWDLSVENNYWFNDSFVKCDGWLDVGPMLS